MWQLKQASKYEKAYCQKADHVIAVNSKDERLLHEYYDLNNVELMNPYYGVDFEKKSNIEKQPKSICFIGQMAREENHLAAMRLIQIFKSMHRDDIQLTIIGAHPSNELQSFECENIHITGFVDKIEDEILKNEMAVFPLTLGAGIKLKVLLACGLGLPVITTDIGAEGIDDEMINGIRAGLMGPLAGIGDSLIVGTYIPILLGIALGFAEGGSPIGPLFYIVVWNATSIWFQHFVYFKGYELGGSAVELLVGEKATAFRESVLVMGQVIVGAMAASWVSISTNLVITRSYDQATGKLTNVTLGEKLDGAFPKVLTMAFVLFAWWLMAKKNVTPVKVLLLFVVIGFVGSVIGFLG